MVSPKRDIPVGDPICRAEHHSGCEHALHFRHWPGLPKHALSPQVRPLLFLWWLGRDHDHFHLLLPSRDEECAH